MIFRRRRRLGACRLLRAAAGRTHKVVNRQSLLRNGRRSLGLRGRNCLSADGSPLRNRGSSHLRLAGSATAALPASPGFYGTRGISRCLCLCCRPSAGSSFAGALCRPARHPRCMALAAALGSSGTLRRNAMHPRRVSRICRSSGACQQSERERQECQGCNVCVGCPSRDAGKGGERTLSDHDLHKVAAKPPSLFSLFVCTPGE